MDKSNTSSVSVGPVTGTNWDTNKMQTLKDLKLLENRLLVKKVVEKQGGIEIPEDTTGSVDAHHFKGVVMCIGPDCKSVKEGDLIMYRDGYTKLKFESYEYYVIRESNVVGIIPKENVN